MRRLLLTTAVFFAAFAVHLVRGREWAEAHRADILRLFGPQR